MGVNDGFPQHCQRCEVDHKLGVVEGWMAAGGGVAGGSYCCASDGG